MLAYCQGRAARTARPLLAAPQLFTHFTILENTSVRKHIYFIAFVLSDSLLSSYPRPLRPPFPLTAFTDNIATRRNKTRDGSTLATSIRFCTCNGRFAFYRKLFAISLTVARLLHDKFRKSINAGSNKESLLKHPPSIHHLLLEHMLYVKHKQYKYTNYKNLSSIDSIA